MAFKLDIFKTLKAIDLNERNWLSKQPEENKNAFVPTVVARWCSGYATDDEETREGLVLFNEMVNTRLYDLQSFPDLQFRLMAASGIGKSRKHAWIPPAKHRQNVDKISGFLLRYWPDARDDELDILMSQFDKKSFTDFVEHSGCDPTEAKELIKLYAKL